MLNAPGNARTIFYLVIHNCTRASVCMCVFILIALPFYCLQGAVGKMSSYGPRVSTRTVAYERCSIDIRPWRLQHSTRTCIIRTSCKYLLASLLLCVSVSNTMTTAAALMSNFNGYDQGYNDWFIAISMQSGSHRPSADVC